jgi:hypothetical protein
MKMAYATKPNTPGAPGPAFGTWDPLTGDLVHFLSNCGVIKAVVDAEVRSAAHLN